MMGRGDSRLRYAHQRPLKAFCWTLPWIPVAGGCVIRHGLRETPALHGFAQGGSGMRRRFGNGRRWRVALLGGRQRLFVGAGING